MVILREIQRQLLENAKTIKQMEIQFLKHFHFYDLLVINLFPFGDWAWNFEF